jgi:hypothetical protein
MPEDDLSHIVDGLEIFFGCFEDFYHKTAF